MKNIYLSVAALLISILLADMEILNTFLFKNGLAVLTNTNYILPIFFAIILLVIKNIYDISLYTDESIPLKLGILSLVMTIVGYIVFYRILLLGVFILFAASHWNRSTVNSYFPSRLRDY